MRPRVGPIAPQPSHPETWGQLPTQGGHVGAAPGHPRRSGTFLGHTWGSPGGEGGVGRSPGTSLAGATEDAAERPDRAQGRGPGSPAQASHLGRASFNPRAFHLLRPIPAAPATGPGSQPSSDPAPAPAPRHGMSCFEEEGSWSLSFSGAGFLGLYHVGVIHCLRERAPRLLRGARRFYGSSSGALAALCLVMDMSTGASGDSPSRSRFRCGWGRGRWLRREGCSRSRAWRPAHGLYTQYPPL